MIVQHRSRPLACQVGLHRPTWVQLPKPRHLVSYRVCAGCGTLLESGGYYDAAATTILALSPLLTTALAVGVGAAVLRTHRSRR